MGEKTLKKIETYMKPKGKDFENPLQGGFNKVTTI